MKRTCTLVMSCLLMTAAVKAQTTAPEQKIKDLNIPLITPVAPTANFVKALTVGKMVYLSGHGPDKPEGGQVVGKIGTELDVEAGRAAARLVGISLLSSLKKEIGSLDRVKRVVKVLGMVNAEASFTQHSQVMNGFSDLMVEVFGESGKHARSSVGMSSLPGNIPVEIEMIVELK